MQKILITGITGQSGSFLAELLLEKGYKVYGLVRRSSTTPGNFRNISHILDKIELLEGDLTDQGSLINAVRISQPDETYNLAAQSFVHDSWKEPEHTSNVTGLGVLRMLVALKHEKPDSKFYQASSSELYGKVQNPIGDKLPETNTVPNPLEGVYKNPFAE